MAIRKFGNSGCHLLGFENQRENSLAFGSASIAKTFDELLGIAHRPGPKPMNQCP